MIRSTDRIRTTHVGSLARPSPLLDLMKAAAEGRPADPAELAETERRAVADVVARQRAAGLDMISDGEQTKTGFYAYIGLQAGCKLWPERWWRPTRQQEAAHARFTGDREVPDRDRDRHHR
jgi:hypothetical protein